MITYTDQSTISPEAVVILADKVKVNTDVQEIEVEHEEDKHTEYTYTVTEYSKDEYIQKQADELTDTQLAVTELYEMMIEG